MHHVSQSHGVEQDPTIVGAIAFQAQAMLGDVIIDNVVDEEVDLLARNRLAPVAIGLLDHALGDGLQAPRVVRNLLTI